MKRKLVAVLAVIGMLSTLLVGCSSGGSAGETAEVKTEELGDETADESAAADTDAAADDDKYIAMIALGFSHQYW